MIIKRIAVGNKEEAFIEERFIDGFNIISSDDNNKGKTIIIQAIGYALGNIPAFPASFPFEDFYYILDFEVDNVLYSVCRRRNEFIVIKEKNIYVFDSVSEYKRYWNKNIVKLPIILHNNVQHVVDPHLFLQLFFCGQDKKDTSNIVNRGMYNKRDFYSMIYSYMGMGAYMMDQDEIDVAKQKLSDLKEEKSSILKQNRILASKKKSASYLSVISDRESFQAKLKQIEGVQEKISNLRKMRNQCAARKTMWENTVKELRSLNKTISVGELRCMDCDSTHIAYKGNKKDSFTFDVSSMEMRNQIIDSITEKIDSYTEEIEMYSLQIAQEQELLQSLLQEDEISIEVLTMYKKELLNIAKLEKHLIEVQKEIDELQTLLKDSKDGFVSQREQQVMLTEELVETMNLIYRRIDKEGTQVFTDLFSVPGKVYSGSDATLFNLVKMYAFANVLKHDFPIIVDSFRAEDLSSKKEKNVIEEFAKLRNQIIFTTTLKEEELGKYDTEEKVNHIDYCNHESNKILQTQKSEQFIKLLEKFLIKY